MARATRSSTTNEKDKPADIPQVSRKGASKKRKRNSNAENEDLLPTKQPRTESKEEGTPDPDDHLEEKEHNDLPSSGSVPIQSADAANILDVLESVDTQGLLDRVFPLPTDAAEATSAGSSSITTMFSLRSLLKSPAQHPTSVLYAAVKHLYPISFHPRFRPSETAAQQLRFCNLASLLLDQASRNLAPVPLEADTVINGQEAHEDAISPTSSQGPLAGVRPRKYALVQHLPTGDWWTSASTGMPTINRNERDLKTLHTAKAELVSVFPSTSDSQLAHKGTLGDYAAKKLPGTAPYKPPPPRPLSCGKFLDYGPYASFAPSFDQDGVEVGRVAMGEVIFEQEMRRRLRSLAKGKRRAFLASGERSSEDVSTEGAISSTAPGPSGKDSDTTKTLESLLTPEEVSGIKSALSTLEMEQAVDELLVKNAKALERLEELQLERLRGQGRGSGAVEVGSEEWDVAQAILDSLGLLASLRPRLSNGDPDHAPLVPPPSVLHKLQRTLPLQATEGWYGTLPEGRTSAFRDDTTVHVRIGAASTSKAVPTPSTPSKATTPAPPYTPAYANPYQAFRGSYGTYTSNHYPNSNYYAAWFANSGRSTPQPTSTQPSLSGNYASYFSSAAPSQRAVANTVLSTTSTATKQQPYSAWNGATTGGYAASNLPPHMRSVVAGAATPPPTTPATASQYNGYYGSYPASR